MGVHGLTSFIARFGDEFRETIYIRNSPVLIDGNNLMYHLYFDGKDPVVTRGENKNRDKTVSCLPLPEAYLFGGDWERYAQNVRYFFQQLKQCEITPIVLLDGAYDESKLTVAMTRFEKSVRDNIKRSKQDGSLVTPGKTYTPVFLKTVFVEVLAEQKITHFQTVGEADATIAYIARLLGDCPILSSDSDFYIYVNARVIPLASLNFKKAKPSKKDHHIHALGKNPFPDKVWTLQGQFTSLPKLCRHTFSMNDPRLLSLAAVILGNDKVHTSVFRNFSPCNGGDLSFRINRVMYWLTSQPCVDTALQKLLAYIANNKRKRKIEERIHASIKEYDGECGEEKVWEYLKKEVDLSLLADELALRRLEVFERFNKLSLQDVRGASVASGSGGDDANSTDSSSSDSECEIIDDEELELPEWYVDAHITGKLQTYLLNLYKNRTVFLQPQVEMYTQPSCHVFSIPIIKVTAGILFGDPETPIKLISHFLGRVVLTKEKPIVTLPEIGSLPVLCPRPGTDPGKVLDPKASYESRANIIIAALGFSPKGEIWRFIEGFPVSYRLWLLTLFYYAKAEIAALETSSKDFSFHECISIVISTFLSVIKNLMVNPSSPFKNGSGNPCIEAINGLYEQFIRNQGKLHEVRSFYQGLENLPNVSLRQFLRGYDIRLPHALSKYVCILHHAEMLNNLLGNPFKSPKVRYSLHNLFIYRCSEVVSGSLKRLKEPCSTADFNELVSEVFAIDEIQKILVPFMEVLKKL